MLRRYGFCKSAELFLEAIFLTWEGALQDRPDSSLILAAAVGLLELMSTGGLISMEWRFCTDCDDLLDMVSEVNEWRFLVFFLASVCFWEELLCAVPDVPSPESTTPDGLSNSMSCLAAELNWNKETWFTAKMIHGSKNTFFLRTHRTHKCR